MDSQANNLYETASQPDEGNDAYTFLEFHTQGEEEFVYPEFQELSQPIRSSSSLWPAPSDSIAAADTAFSTESSPKSKLRGGVSNSNNNNNNSAASGSGSSGNNGSKEGVVEALAAGMNGLNFEETGDDDVFYYGKGTSLSMLESTVGSPTLLVLQGATSLLVGNGSVIHEGIHLVLTL